MEKFQYEIGEIFEFYGLNYKVVKDVKNLVEDEDGDCKYVSSDCDICAFHKTILCLELMCLAEERNDNTKVHFEKV